MSTQFTYHEKGMDHPEHPRRRASFLLRVRFKFAKVHGLMRVQRDGGDLGPPRTVAECNRITRNWTKTAKVGARLNFFDDAQQDSMVYHFRAVEVKPPIPAPDTAPPLGPLYVRVVMKHGYVTNLGNWFCRFIAGTRDVSRHGYYSQTWKGAAQDFGCDTSQQLSDLADEVIRWANDPQDPFYNKVATVIVHDRIWERGVGWQHYGGIYHYHVHVDVDAGVPCSP